MANKPQKELGGPRKMSTGTKVIIGVFAVIMALSMMLPSLTSIFAGSTQQAEQQEEAEQNKQAEQDNADQSKDAQNKDAQPKEEQKIASEELAARVPDNDSMKTATETNAKKAATYEKKLVDDPKNLAALLNAGQAYMSWGSGISYYASTDDEKAYVNDVIKKAVEYFDRYLAIEPAKSVKVDRALCQSYMGDPEGATTELEKLAKEEPTYPLVWANLGMLYQAQSENEKATEAYTKAVETDPKDEYGAKSYGESQLISLNSKVSSPSDPGDASVESSSSTAGQGLSETLSQSTGVGF